MKKTFTTFVYPYVKTMDDLELKCSIKSVQKNFKGNPIFVIIGDKPSFTGIDYIHIVSERKPFRAIDIAHKLQTVINDTRIPNDFVWMYDDIYFINEVDVSDLKKVYALQDLTGKNLYELNFDSSKKWASMFMATMTKIKAEGKKVINYETHLPRYLNKKKTQQMIVKYDLFNNKLLFASLYFSNTKDPIFLQPKTDDVKLGIYMSFSSMDVLEKKIRNKKFLNYSEKAFTDAMRKLIVKLFLQQS